MTGLFSLVAFVSLKSTTNALPLTQENVCWSPDCGVSNQSGMSAVPEKFHFRRRVEFCETDAAGIAHFVSFYVFMEQAEHALFRSIGSSVVVENHDDSALALSWPRVNCTAEFHGSVRFEDELDIYVSISKLGSKSLGFAFEMLHEEKRICTGSITTVCCLVGGGKLTSVEIPDDIRQSLSKYLSE